MNRILFARCLRLAQFKSVEIQLSHWAGTPLFSIDLTRRRKCDHPGVEFCLTLFGRELRIDYYDHRHWNHESDTFETLD
jgi:hypothetical protein